MEGGKSTDRACTEQEELKLDPPCHPTSLTVLPPLPEAAAEGPEGETQAVDAYTGLPKLQIELLQPETSEEEATPSITLNRPSVTFQSNKWEQEEEEEGGGREAMMDEDDVSVWVGVVGKEKK